MILNSFLGCSSIHALSSLISFKTKDAPNLISCISFQLYFIFRSLSLFYQSHYSDEYDQQLVSQQIINNLNSLIGYFIYDSLYLMKTSYFSFYLLHHLLGISMLQLVKQFGAPISLLSQYNLFCFIAEVTNPFINFRHFTRDTIFYPLNIKLIFGTYSIFRMILFPIMSKQLYHSIQFTDPSRATSLIYLFSLVYLMSSVWYIKIVGMYRKLK